MDQRWLAVKDSRIDPIAEAGSTPALVHAWARQAVVYQPDEIDDWALPVETLSRGYGDCEDFAILERALLIAAGYPESLWLLLCFDLLMRQDHALLVAGGLILDCRGSEPQAALSDYRPVIAFCGDYAVSFGRRR